MSFDALKWALRQKVGDGKAKAVLIALANHANRKSGLAWPSIAALVETSEFDRKTVFRALAYLRGRFLEDTGDRRGRTHQVTVWRFRRADAALSKNPESGTLSDDGKSPGSGTVPEAEPFPKPARKSPGNGTRNQLREPVDSSNEESCRSPNKSRSKYPAPDGVTDEQWRDHLAVRSAKRIPMTDTAYSRLCNKLECLAAEGWPPGEMISRAVEHGWTTVYPPKDQRHEHSKQPSGIGRTEAAAIAAAAALGIGDERA